MKKLLLLILGLGFLTILGFSQINSNSPAVPFGSRTSYGNGIMPSNLPTGGTYGNSQAAADAYTAWKSNHTVACATGTRVKFDAPDVALTVSEGIAYGMLLSAYAGDKPLFDDLWKYYKANSTNGIMNWKINGCSGILGAGGATDAELDAAMALLVAENQWPTATSPYDYSTEANTLIAKIRTTEIHPTTYQTVNGNGWGFSDNCRNPSYFAPAYYRQFAVAESSQASFWNSTVTASQSFLLTNRNATTGLVGNWADNNATSNACNGPNEYGWDACRNPWRMATDVLWYGSATATTGADICTKLSNWINGWEASLKGPLSQSAGNPSVGTYKNGAFGTYALALMTMTSAKQTNLNTAYTNIVNLGTGELYFSATLRTITLFMMTGNFWKPGSTVSPNPLLTAAATNAAGTKITLTFNKNMATPAAGSYSGFTLKKNGTTVSSAFTAIALNGTTAIDLTLTTAAIPSDVFTISYTPGTIQSSDANSLAAFSNQAVTNAMAGSNTLIADCEDVNRTKLLTYWYSYAAGSSTIVPLASATSPFTMTLGGANGTDSAAVATGNLVNTAAPDYESAGIGFAFAEPEADYDLTGATGISFWHNGDALNFSIMLSTVEADAGKDYSFAVPAHTSWTLVEVPFTSMAQPTWVTPTTTWDPSKITRLQWQVKDGAARSYSIGIDEVTVMGKTLTLPDPGTPVDKTTLVSAISSANTIYSAAIEGAAEGQYPSGSKATLLAAINAATTVNTNANATQIEVNNAVSTLNAAVTTFQGLVNGPVATNTLIADCEDANRTKLLTYWYSYAAGSSTIVPLASATSPFTMTLGGANGTDSAAVATGNLVNTAAPDYESAGIGFAFAEPEADYDLTGATGISFWHNGDALNFSIMLSTVEADAGKDYSFAVPAHTSWTLVEVPFTSMAQPTWVTPTTTWDPSKITKLQWQVKDGVARSYSIGIDEVTVMGKTLTLPIPVTVNKAALIAKITEAENTRDAATWGTAPGQYPTSAGMTLENAISAAATINNNSAATQLQVDAAVVTLNNAIIAFQASVITVNKTTLVNSITSANSYYSTSVEGTAPGQYPIGAKATLYSAISAAQTVNSNSAATQLQVDNANTTLQTAINTFLASVNPAVNKSTLVSAITNANSIYVNSTEGTADGQYPLGSRSTLLIAINTAQAVNTNSASTQTQVDNAVTTLNTAVTTFLNSVYGMNTSTLVNKIAEGNAAYALSIGNTGNIPGNYPQSAVTMLSNAISAAETVLANATTQVEITNAVNALQNEIVAFEASIIPQPVDKSDLSDLVDIAEIDFLASVGGTDVGEYPIALRNALYQAIQDANTILNNSAATQAEVDAELNDLQLAYNLFIASEITAIDDVNNITLRVAPNPCSNTIYIESGKEIATVTVINILGKVQQTKQVHDTQTTLAVSNIAQGVYLISIKYTDGSIETVKITKK